MAARKKLSHDIKWYVYELVDPRNGEVFYVGKGCGDRMLQHGKPCDRTNQHKTSVIKKIGYDNIIRRKIAEFWDEQAAYICESDRICDLLDRGYLTNSLIATTLSDKLRARKERFDVLVEVLNIFRTKFYLVIKYPHLIDEVGGKTFLGAEFYRSMVKPVSASINKSASNIIGEYKKLGKKLPAWLIDNGNGHWEISI